VSTHGRASRRAPNGQPLTPTVLRDPFLEPFEISWTLRLLIQCLALPMFSFHFLIQFSRRSEYIAHPPAYTLAATPPNRNRIDYKQRGSCVLVLPASFLSVITEITLLQFAMKQQSQGSRVPAGRAHTLSLGSNQRFVNWGRRSPKYPASQ
jgi:hypothetical protein